MVEKNYLLLTPGPLTTSEEVKQAMDFDYCTWDDDYKKITQSFRHSLLEVAQVSDEEYTAVPIQGSGTYGVESVISSTISDDDTLLIAMNGAYGKRIGEMADIYGINHVDLVVDERQPITLEAVTKCLDAMSSFGGIPIDVKANKIDYLISSSNKCIQGVPGFSFVIARKEALEKAKGMARTLSLDLYGQYIEMERNNGKWRFTSPTHVVHAFYEALKELKEEGGVEARHQRYENNQKHLAKGMEELGFKVLIDEKFQSPIITSFIYPTEDFDFHAFYQQLKSDGFVIYPGKISQVPTFRIGNIGEVYDEDITKLLLAIKEITE